MGAVGILLEGTGRGNEVRVWCGWFVCFFAGWQSGLKSLDFEDGSSSRSCMNL